MISAWSLAMQALGDLPDNGAPEDLKIIAMTPGEAAAALKKYC